MDPAPSNPQDGILPKLPELRKCKRPGRSAEALASNPFVVPAATRRRPYLRPIVWHSRAACSNYADIPAAPERPLVKK